MLQLLLSCTPRSKPNEGGMATPETKINKNVSHGHPLEPSCRTGPRRASAEHRDSLLPKSPERDQHHRLLMCCRGVSRKPATLSSHLVFAT